MSASLSVGMKPLLFLEPWKIMQLSASAWAKLGRAGVGVSPELKRPTNVLSVKQITETL